MGKNVRTTVALPEELLAAVDRAVQEGRARSRNEFLSLALRQELATLERTRGASTNPIQEPARA